MFLKYDAFRAVISAYPIVGRSVLNILLPGEPHLEIQISRWKKRGKLLPLTRDLFLLNEADRKTHPSGTFLACEMYKPSYVSLEYALAFHGLIPEKVADFTCVTTRKTRRIENALGTFTYRHVKVEGYGGFTARKDEAGLPFFMAEPEKALVDFVYLNLEKFESARTFGEVITESYRLQNTGTLNRGKVLRLARQFGTIKLLALLKELPHD